MANWNEFSGLLGRTFLLTYHMWYVPLSEDLLMMTGDFQIPPVKMMIF